jgi:hypothetical protein
MNEKNDKKIVIEGAIKMPEFNLSDEDMKAILAEEEKIKNE